LALKNSGSNSPVPIQKKIKQMEPISELKNTLTEDLKTWGDIWAVRVIGRIGNKVFVPNLMHILRNSDSLDYIYSDAIRAMNALDNSADENDTISRFLTALICNHLKKKAVNSYNTVKTEIMSLFTASYLPRGMVRRGTYWTKLKFWLDVFRFLMLSIFKRFVRYLNILCSL
jgi:hypothetical protein